MKRTIIFGVIFAIPLLTSVVIADSIEYFDATIDVTRVNEPTTPQNDTEYFDLLVDVTLTSSPSPPANDTEYFDLSITVTKTSAPTTPTDTEYFDLLIDVTKTSPNATAPIADFTYNISGLKVTFKDESIGNITKWNWSFGDGEYSAKQNPTHTYKKTGTYKVILTVWNNYGLSDNKTVSIFVFNIVDFTSSNFSSYIKVAWKSFIFQKPRWKIDPEAISYNKKFILPEKITVSTWIFGIKEEAINSVSFWGVKENAKGWIFKRDDFIKLSYNTKTMKISSVDNANNSTTTKTVTVYEITDDIKEYDMLVIIPNPGFFDKEFWLELTKSSKV